MPQLIEKRTVGDGETQRAYGQAKV